MYLLVPRFLCSLFLLCFRSFTRMLFLLPLIFCIFTLYGFPFIYPSRDSLGFLNLWVGSSFLKINSRKFSAILSFPETVLKCILQPFTYLYASHPLFYILSFHHSMLYSLSFLVINLELI